MERCPVECVAFMTAGEAIEGTSAGWPVAGSGGLFCAPVANPQFVMLLETMSSKRAHASLNSLGIPKVGSRSRARCCPLVSGAYA